MRPIWDDVRTLKGSFLPGVDIMYGGFPCQDISTMGFKKGLGGERSGLFYELVRLTEEMGPSFVFLENVSRGIKKEEPRIAADLKSIGYTARALEMSAFDVTAKSYGFQRGGGSGRVGKIRKGFSQLLGGPPNPEFLEWLMGYPIGWTAIEPWATQ